MILNKIYITENYFVLWIEPMWIVVFIAYWTTSPKFPMLKQRWDIIKYYFTINQQWYLIQNYSNSIHRAI